MDSHSPKNDELPPPSYADTIQNNSTLSTQQSFSSHLDSPGNDTQISNNSNKDIHPMPIPQVPTITPIVQQPGQIMPVLRSISQQPAPGLTRDVQSCISPSLSWMPKPSPDITPNDCPPGLEWLSQLDQVICASNADPQESLSPYLQNKYAIKNNVGQTVFYVVEDPSTAGTNMFGFQLMEIGVYDCNSNKVMQWSRTLSGTGIRCLGNNMYKLNVSCPPGNLIGSVIQSSIFGPKHTITSPNGLHQLAINGPGHCCYQIIPGNLVSFEIISNGKVIGNITRRLPSVNCLICDTHISFPMDLHVNFKAMAIAFGVILDILLIGSYRYHNMRGNLRHVQPHIHAHAQAQATFATSSYSPGHVNQGTAVNAQYNVNP